eukprot:355261-Chlamydomonas_euryale.AAC.4
MGKVMRIRAVRPRWCEPTLQPLVVCAGHQVLWGHGCRRRMDGASEEKQTLPSLMRMQQLPHTPHPHSKQPLPPVPIPHTPSTHSPNSPHSLSEHRLSPPPPAQQPHSHSEQPQSRLSGKLVALVMHSMHCSRRSKS